MSNKKRRLRVTCVQCPDCLDILYSRAHHDFRPCTCGKVFIDGGFDYCRIGGDLKGGKIFSKYVIGVTKKDLYKDYSTRKDNYGLIKTTKRKFHLEDIRPTVDSKISIKTYITIFFSRLKNICLYIWNK